MKKSNWPNNWDLSHPNWTGRTPNKASTPLHTRRDEPPVLAQVALGVLVVVTFMLGMFAL